MNKKVLLVLAVCVGFVSPVVAMEERESFICSAAVLRVAQTYEQPFELKEVAGRSFSLEGISAGTPTRYLLDGEWQLVDCPLRCGCRKGMPKDFVMLFCKRLKENYGYVPKHWRTILDETER